MDQNFFKKFSESLKKILINSESLAAEQKTIMNTEHLLLSLSISKDNLASDILTNSNITADRIQLMASLTTRKEAEATKEKIASDAKDSIRVAIQIASSYSHFTVDCEHLLMALVSKKTYNSYQIIERMGIDPKEIAKQIEAIFGGIKQQGKDREPEIKFDNIEEEPIQDSGFLGPMGPMPGIGGTMGKTKKNHILELFTTNLNKLASENKLDPVIGREIETERIIQVLSRRTKNNPILMGEPGVGKTSIVEGLAQRIIAGKVPDRLLNNEILSLDMGSIIAGTMYRGQFESRMKKVMNEVKKKGNVILFIDEIHTVVGAGSTEGSIDAANLLKPMLAKGELRLIGSTTFDEYKKHIERDPAFERRLQPVKIQEPSIKETMEILNGIKKKYETHHNVVYTKEAITAAATLSKRYINDRFLPDKAVDLIDEAAAATHIVSDAAVELARLKNKLREILRKKDELIMAEKYKEATLLREQEIIIEEAINKLRTNRQPEKLKKIDEENIAKVVSRWTGIPVTNMTLHEKKRFLEIEKRIKRKVLGQNDAIHAMAQAIRRARVGISNPNRPTGSFIFLGPTGVGKTELAKVVAEEILGDRKALIKIDMSEFMERHNVSRLIGAPAGYVGYEEGGKLTEIVRKNPYSVILLDEIEKAHPEVFNILLQVLEDGELTDSKGRTVDFKNTIIIMTSNLGTDRLTHGAMIGFQKRNALGENYERLEEDVHDAVNKHFKPEFLNRIDKIIIFKPLDHKSIEKIVELQLKELKTRLSHNKYKLSFSSEAVKFLAKRSFNPNFGARPVRKMIAEKIETPISELILEEKLKPGNTINVQLKGNEIHLKVA